MAIGHWLGWNWRRRNQNARLARPPWCGRPRFNHETASVGRSAVIPPPESTHGYWGSAGPRRAAADQSPTTFDFSTLNLDWVGPQPPSHNRSSKQNPNRLAQSVIS